MRLIETCIGKLRRQFYAADGFDYSCERKLLIMLSMDALKEYGVKTNQGLERCCNMEAFYFKMITASVNDANFEKLGKALDAKDLKEAFEAAHALKGIAGNLALDPLYDAVCEIVEPLRAGEDKDYTEGYKKVLEARDKLAAII